MSKMKEIVGEILALVLGTLGIASIILANETDCWRHDAKDQFSSVGLSFRCRGLWSECLLDNMAHIWTCDIPMSYLGDVPAGMAATRILIVVSCGVCVLAVLMLIFGMKCTKLVGNTRDQKDKLIRSSGALFLFGGMTGIGGLLWYGIETFIKYREEVALGIPGVTYELGYSYWLAAGGVVCILASGLTSLMVQYHAQMSVNLRVVQGLSSTWSSHPHRDILAHRIAHERTYI